MHELPLRCEDIAGNVIEKSISFNVKIDEGPPLIKRVYKSQGSLILITDEPAKCAFSKRISSQCTFDFENGTLMEGENITHSTGFDPNAIYYIKCKDEFDKIPSGCSIIARGVDLAKEGKGINLE